MDTALEVRGLCRKYGGFTLDHVSFRLPAGCIMGFIGENGAGKSTTIRLILDLAHRDAGEVTMLGQSRPEGIRGVRENVGVVMDETSFPENLNASDINTVLRNIYCTWDMGRVKALCRRFSLPDKKAVKEYSRGMKMKLAIAAALSHDAKLLILDEATSGLDPIVRDEILDVFLEFIQDESHAVLISSHILSDLEKICDYITFIHQGRIVFSEEKDALLDQYRILKCSEAEFAMLDPAQVKGCRRSAFGVEALVPRGAARPGQTTERAGIEALMLFYVKGDAK